MFTKLILRDRQCLGFCNGSNPIKTITMKENNLILPITRQPTDKVTMIVLKISMKNGAWREINI